MSFREIQGLPGGKYLAGMGNQVKEDNGKLNIQIACGAA
jgi:hypothetical protein